MKNKLAKAIRIISVSPIMATTMLLLLFFLVPNFFSKTLDLILAILFLAILPVLAYPICFFIPALKAKGRTFERNLAIVFSMLGYVFGIVYCYAFGDTPFELTIYLTYLFTGLLIALFSFVFKYKASGHASGVSGPIVALSYFVSPWILFGYLFFLAVLWSSLQLKRHTIMQFLIGGVLPALSFGLALIIAL